MWRSAFRAWGRWVVGSRIRDGLDGIHVSGIDRVRDLARTQPVLLAANHVSWWDGLAVVALDDLLEVDRRVLMHQHRLDDYPWFQAFGAMGLDTRSAGGARAGLRRMAAFLSEPGRAGWIFPQGEQRPSHLRPLGLEPGVALLARRAKVPVVPVSLAYVFREQPVPALFIRFGAPIAWDDPALLTRLEDALVEGLDHIDLHPGFELALASRSPSELGARMLSHLWTLLHWRPSWTS